MKRTWLTLGIPGLMLVVIVVPFALFWGDLPDPMAVHWALSGEPNGSLAPVLLLVLLIALFGAMMIAVRREVARSWSEAPSFVGGLFAVGAILVAVSWISVLANRDVAEWAAADEFGLISLLGVLVVGLVVGMLGWVAAGGRSVSRDPGVAPRLDLVEPSNAVWSGRGVGKVTSAIGIAVIVAGLVTWGWTSVLLIAVGVLALLFAVVRVTVSQRGAYVSLGPWAFPTWRVRLDEVARAEVEKVNPMAYGGWGYRMRPGVRAVVVRSGSSLRLVRSDRSDLVYTVDDAETGAGLINSLVGARSE